MWCGCKFNDREDPSIGKEHFMKIDGAAGNR